MILYILKKPLCFFVSDEKIFENCILRTYCLTIWKTLVGDHPGIISAEFGQIPIVYEKKLFLSFPYIINVRLWPPEQCQFLPQGHSLNNFGRRPLDDVIYWLWKLGRCSFGQEDFFKVHFENKCFDPVTFLFNQLDWFKQLW